MVLPTRYASFLSYCEFTPHLPYLSVFVNSWHGIFDSLTRSFSFVLMAVCSMPWNVLFLTCFGRVSFFSSRVWCETRVFCFTWWMEVERAQRENAFAQALHLGWKCWGSIHSREGWNFRGTITQIRREEIYSFFLSELCTKYPHQTVSSHAMHHTSSWWCNPSTTFTTDPSTMLTSNTGGGFVVPVG